MVVRMRGTGVVQGHSRRLALWAGLIAFAIAAAVTPVSAQPGAGCTSVTVAPPATTDFTDGDIRALTFEVTNPNPIPVEVRFTFSPPPTGWNWPQAGGPVALDAQASGTFTMNVQRVGEGARTAPLDFTATTNCTGPLGLGQATVSNGIVLTSVAPLPGPSGDADGGASWPWLLLVLGGVVLVGGVFVVRGQAPKIQAECTEPDKEVHAGRGTSFPINLANRSSKPLVIDLEVGDVPEGWSALTALPELTLGPKEERTLWLMVRAPPDAEPGQVVDVHLGIEPEAGRSHELAMRATVAGATA